MFSVILNYFASFNDDIKTDTFTKLILAITIHIIVVSACLIMYHSYDVKYMLYVIIIYCIIVLMDFIAFYVIRGKILIEPDESNESNGSNEPHDKESSDEKQNDTEDVTNDDSQNGIEHTQFELNDGEYIDKEMYDELQRKPNSDTSSFIVEKYDEMEDINSQFNVKPNNDNFEEIDVEQFVNNLNEELYKEEMDTQSRAHITHDTNDVDDVINITELKKKSDELVKRPINIGLKIDDPDEKIDTNEIEENIENIENIGDENEVNGNEGANNTIE